MRQLRALVRGRVQGVCFRAETSAVARRLGLDGTVRNCSDGGVEVVAAGEDAALGQLLDFLRRGPTLARVDAVETDWTEVADIGKGFRVTA
ncbi:MAG: acylphosphatase [Candidatus Eisenbacteria bacterium]|uniref:acylphosphatase n=1 Tax=Eiseniibacteriota bacterium TaxID=2212470 RepID=A0A937XCE5_UNCEI|nr:acylphosphatase [Candidatus Eisenbacteria bacterium]